jgi:hypothetical protein
MLTGIVVIATSAAMLRTYDLLERSGKEGTAPALRFGESTAQLRENN